MKTAITKKSGTMNMTGRLLVGPLALSMALGALGAGCGAMADRSEATIADPARASLINKLIAEAGKIDDPREAKEEPKGDPKPEPGKYGDHRFNCQVTDVDLVTAPDLFAALDPFADVLWPGSLVQGRSLAEGGLDPIPVRRAPGTITMTLVNSSSGPETKPISRRIEEPSLSAAIHAQREILSGELGATPAHFDYQEIDIYSMEQLRIAVNANARDTDWGVSASVNFDKDDGMNRILVRFTQQQFTMAFDPPQGAAGVFAPDVTRQDLEPYVGPLNPPLYIGSVVYGRVLYLLVESRLSREYLKAALNGRYSWSDDGTVTVDARAEYERMWRATDVQAFAIGGNAEEIIRAATGVGIEEGTDALNVRIEKVKRFLGNANISPQNPAKPISFTLRYLDDSTQVRVVLATSYKVRDCTPTVGCDPMDLKKVVDVCGVCGGNGLSCSKCPMGVSEEIDVNGMGAVQFNLPEGRQGESISMRWGRYSEYDAGWCRLIWWHDVRFECRNKKWLLGSLRPESEKRLTACPDDDYNHIQVKSARIY